MLGLEGAEHEETAPDASDLVIRKLACSLVGQKQTIRIAPGSRAHAAYGRGASVEEFRCNYGLNPAYRQRFEASGLRVSGADANGEARIVELPGHRFYVATLFLPQLASSVESPHPLIAAYLRAAI